jgi:tryptophan synthase alpha chain
VRVAIVRSAPTSGHVAATSAAWAGGPRVVGGRSRLRPAQRPDVSAPSLSSPSGEQRIAAAFDGGADVGRQAALMPFFMGGFPSLDASREIGEAYADGGADLVELGVPSPDPLADGPVIRAAGSAALHAGATVDGVLDVARAVSARVPVVVMCYAKIVRARGARRFAAELCDAGASGLIVPDLSLEEGAALLDACDATGVALAPLIEPTTSEMEIARIRRRARGFVYAVSVTGTTGERPVLPSGVATLIRRAKPHSEVPVALGFGIASPEHAAQAAAAGADGVIVGSRRVRAAEAADPPARVRDLVAAFSAALGPPARAAADRREHAIRSPRSTDAAAA